jgi:hypothetical protein
MASIVLGAILNNPIGYVVATILTIAFLAAWALGKEDSEQEFEENKLFSGTIPAVPAMEESIGADFPAIIGHADLLIQRLGMEGGVTVTSDLSAYQINLGLFIRATGPAKVTIVNPDQDAARRIEAVAGPDIKRIWVPKRIQEWLQDERSRER